MWRMGVVNLRHCDLINPCEPVWSDSSKLTLCVETTDLRWLVVFTVMKNKEFKVLYVA